jgi:lambda repressor-like predicted transcriptional regulator
MYSVNIADDTFRRHRRILAGFIAKGTSLSAWCRENGVKSQNAHRALRGQWTGRKAQELVAEIVKFSGAEE